MLTARVWNCPENLLSARYKVELIYYVPVYFRCEKPKQVLDSFVVDYCCTLWGAKRLARKSLKNFRTSNAGNVVKISHKQVVYEISN